MKRRSFLLGLLAAPLAPLVAKLLPKDAPLTYMGIPVIYDERLECSEVWLINTHVPVEIAHGV